MKRYAPLFMFLLLACSSDSESAADISAAADIASADTTTASDSAPAPPKDAARGPALDQPGACGTPTFREPLGLRRHPYLQSTGQDTIRVAWTSTEEGVGAVEFATSPSGPWIRMEARRELFDVERTKDVVDYWAYDATLTGLEDGKTYCYRVAQGDELLAEGLTFSAAWSDPDRPIRILAFGDSGNGSPDQMAVRDTFMDKEFDLFLHLGDMAYGSGTFVQFEDYVFSVYKDLLHKTPTWPTMGNHEYKTRLGRPYLDVYYLPEQAVLEEDQERYYSFDYGDVHFVSVETNDGPLIEAAIYDTVDEPNMLEWLRQDLAASDKRWKIAFFHHPPYSSSERDPNGAVRANVLPILEEGGVDLVLTGHDHQTERTKPIWQGELAEDNPRAITYIVAGAGGAGLRVTEAEWWTAFVDDKRHSFVSLEINGCTLTGEAIAAGGEVTDSFELDGCDE